ncbi:MAG: FIST N-terminal domain-containing protein [Myxococcales bacterium]
METRMKPVASALTRQTDSAAAAAELVKGLADIEPRCIVFFAGIQHQGQVLGEALSKRFPAAHVVGCSGNGEFSEGGYGKGGAVALALGADKVRRCASALARPSGGVDEAMASALTELLRRAGRAAAQPRPAAPHRPRAGGGRPRPRGADQRAAGKRRAPDVLRGRLGG